MVFKFKILYGVPVGVARVLLAFSFEKLGTGFRVEIELRFVDYVFTVVDNIGVIIGIVNMLQTYSNLTEADPQFLPIPSATPCSCREKPKISCIVMLKTLKKEL